MTGAIKRHRYFLQTFRLTRVRPFSYFIVQSEGDNSTHSEELMALSVLKCVQSFHHSVTFGPAALRNRCFLVLLIAAVHPLCYAQSQTSQRDPLLVEVLARVIDNAGGSQTVATLHDLTESGEITFHSDKSDKGSVLIQTLGANHFRMEADVPGGKRTWIVKAGVGSRKDKNGKVTPLQRGGAINLENLTFPIAHFAEALKDAQTDISLVRIEHRGGRSIYRLRVKGRLGLSAVKTAQGTIVTKDLLVDALNFTILSVEDRPFELHQARHTPDKPSREIDFGDFRTIQGILVPFSITTKLMGQETLTIHLSNVVFNRGLSEQDFRN